MKHTTYLYCLARRESDSDRWYDLATGVDRRDFCARLRQDGIGWNSAERWAEQAALAASAAAPVSPGGPYRVGDRFDYSEAGPRRESYRVVAIAVTPPSLAS